MMERLQEWQRTAVVNLARAEAAFAATLQYVEEREVFVRPVRPARNVDDRLAGRTLVSSE